MDKQTVAIDFDGVLNDYSGWKGADHLGLPRENCHQFLAHLADQYRVVIHSTRSPEKIRDWLSDHGLSSYVDEITDHKPPALAYVDDRAICFTGDYFEVLQRLAGFRTHWQSREPTP